MRLALVTILFGVFAVALGISVQQHSIDSRHKVHYKSVDKQHLEKQKHILRLFRHVNQPCFYDDHIDIAKTYVMKDHLHQYTKPEVVTEFLDYYYNDIIPRDSVFSIFHDEHLNHAIALFKVFYHSKNYETLYKTAVWARHYVNPGLFLYSFSVAVLHHHSTYGIELPPIYEIYPHYFYSSEVIHKAQQHKQEYDHHQHKQGFTIKSNYSGYYLNAHHEQPLSYYTEDVGINAYYYYYNLYHPFWLDQSEIYHNCINRGEEHYYFYQQFLARFYLERLSNDQGKINIYNYGHPFEIGYTSSLVYPNGLSFPHRPNWADFVKDYYYEKTHSIEYEHSDVYQLVQDYERRIRDSIDFGYVKTKQGKVIDLFGEEGFNTVGNIIEGNPGSPNLHYYGHLEQHVRQLLGYGWHSNNEDKIVPSVLEHYETSQRDPAFYQFYKHIVQYYQKYKHHLPHYSHNDLAFPGVRIEKVHIDRLITYFENFHTNIDNAVYVTKKEGDEDTFHVRVHQQRLNHKPFTYKIHVVSEQPAEAVVRVFIGPKYDEHGRHIHINENRVNFVEFDRFKHKLIEGHNIIERNSQSIYLSHDYVGYMEMYQQVSNAVDGDEEFTVYPSDIRYTYPLRFLLPKGKRGGQTYQFYVIVTPHRVDSHHKTKQEALEHKQKQFYSQGHEKEYTYHYPVVGLGVQHIDSHPLGYPFDRPIDQRHFYVPNAHFEDVVIYHKHFDEINTSNPQEEHFSQHYSENQNYGYRENYH